MNEHKWGINWQRYHADRQDMPHIEVMQYRSFTTYEWMWSNRDFVNELLSVARKDAIFLNRDHPLSEQKDLLWKRDPAQKGRNHADEWAAKVQSGNVFTPLDRTYFLGINEPDSHQYQRQIDSYNEAFCRRMQQHGLRAAAYSFGVGHPSTIDLLPKNPPDWSWYATSAAAVLEGDHIVATHEYGAPMLLGYGWEYWCNRIAACPYPFKVIFDECGIDNGVIDSGNLKGYAAFMSAELYLQWLNGFQVGMAERAHMRKAIILACNIFGYDHGSGEDKDWRSFDIRPMRPQLEAFRWTQTSTPLQPVDKPPVVILPSYVANDKEKLSLRLSGLVTATVLNVRAGPATTYPIVGKLDKDYAVKVSAISGTGQQAWYQIEIGQWVYSSFVKLADAPPIEKWQRSIAFVARWEGGYQNIANDAGNWTGGEVGRGENKGTNWGVSAASYPHLDIINLTQAEAHAIFKVDYWKASGADQLDWPACLLVFDTAILHGKDIAKLWLKDVGPNPYIFAANRLRVYTRMQNWDFWSKGWIRRVADLLDEMAK